MFSITGSWLGVEWDDSKRGKHSGSKDGKFYFRTHIPNAGSFIRPKLVSGGSTLSEALNARYGIVENGGVEKDLSVKGVKGQETAVELVGAEKVNLTMSHLEHLVQISLEGFFLNGIGEHKTILKKLKTFDFGRSLLKTWGHVSFFISLSKTLLNLSLTDIRIHAIYAQYL